MAEKRLTVRQNLREDIFDSITPNVFMQPEIKAPHGKWLPAPWLPVQFTKSNTSAGTDAFTISSGKAVAFDAEGYIVPAGMRSTLGGNSGTTFASTVITYTATDVSWGVIDITTGVRVATAKTVSGEQFADAVMNRGLLREADVTTAGGTFPATNDAHVAIIADLFISRPIGVVAYDVLVPSGQPWRGDQWYTNYSLQDLIQFLTEAQLQLPHRVAGSTAADAFAPATLDGAGSETYAAGSLVSAGEYWNATNVEQHARYAASLTAASPVVALGLANQNVARNTDRTPVSCDVTGVLLRERKSAADIARAGDWYLDSEVGVFFISSVTWDVQVALGAPAGDITFTYNFYTDTGVAGAHQYVHFDGPCKPGDFVAVDSQSNFTVATAAQLLAIGEIVGRVLEVVVEPHALMKEVKTAWQLTGVSAASQMPGSATKGFTDLITLSGETVADQVVTLNIRV